MSYGKCAGCWHFDSRNGYCPIIDRDVNNNCGCKQYESYWEHSQKFDDEI